MRLAAIVALTAVFFLGAAARAAAQMIDEPVAPAVALEINRNLAKLGYPVDPENDSITPDSQSAVFRIFLRLGRGYEDADLATIRATLAGLAEREEFPCPETNAGPEKEASFVNATLKFTAPRPEEQLAAVYLRLAQCRPALLTPQKMTAPVKLKAEPHETGAALPSFPIHRTARSVALFREAAAILDETMDGVLFVPGLRPWVQSVTINRPVSEAIYQYTDNKYELVADAPKPSQAMIDVICEQYGHEKGCATAAELNVARHGQSGLIYAYEMAVPHFRIVLEDLRVNSAYAEQVIADAVDYAQKLYNDVGEGAPADDRYYYIDYYLDETSTQLSPVRIEPACHDDCNEPSLMDDLKYALQNMEDFRKQIGWIVPDDPSAASDAEAAKRRDTRIIVVDKAFDQVPVKAPDEFLDTQNANHCPNPKKITLTKLGQSFELFSLITICRLKHSFYAFLRPDTPSLRYAGGDFSDPYGHGVHVMHLASGANASVDINGERKDWGGFGDDARITTDGMPEDTYKSSSLESQGDDIFMAFSHSWDDSNCSLQMNEQLHKAHEQAKKDRLGKPVAERRIEIIAQPYELTEKECQNPAPTDCRTQHRLACLGQFSRGIIVAPLGVDGRLIKEFEVSQYETKKYDALEEAPMLAAPGESLVSFDYDGTDAPVLAKRKGSSVATPIVAALVARVREKFSVNDLADGEIKDWLFANSTPLSENDRDSVIGTVNFARSLRGKPSLVNLWRPETHHEGECQARGGNFFDEAGACLTRYTKLHVSDVLLQKMQSDETDDIEPTDILAFFGAAGSNNTALEFLLKTEYIQGRNDCEKANTPVPCYQHHRHALELVQNPLDWNGESCALKKDDALAPPCLCAENGTNDEYSPVYLEDFSHIVSIKKGNIVRLDSEKPEIVQCEKK